MNYRFPGMDPYLEGYLWPDVHNALAAKIRQILAPAIQPKYVARLNIYVVEDTHPESDLGIMYPDVEIMLRKGMGSVNEPEAAYGDSPITPPTQTVPVLEPVEIQIPVVEIRDQGNNKLITSIEILSPVNKRDPGFQPYIRKRQQIIASGINLLEIDLLRRGKRCVSGPGVGKCDYLVSLTRSGSRQTELWEVDLATVLPTVPVPLLPGDHEAVLDIQQAVKAIYEEAAYHLSIDYSQKPPPPELPSDAWMWIKSLSSQALD